MKKIKLFTALATAGMTTGILLPLVTSCNVAATGEIKFRLEEGITAEPVSFKVGDKVVIKYEVTAEDATVTGEGITVKFDGWKVQPSKKTWGYDIVKKQIIIYNAPTTDITVKISLVGVAKRDDDQVVKITLQSGGNYYYYWNGYPDEPIESTTLDGTIGNKFGTVLGSLRAYNPNEDTTASTFKIVGGDTIDLNDTITKAVTIEPTGWTGSGSAPAAEGDPLILNIESEWNNGFQLIQVKNEVDEQNPEMVGTWNPSGNVEIDEGSFDTPILDWFKGAFNTSWKFIVPGFDDPTTLFNYEIYDDDDEIQIGGQRFTVEGETTFNDYIAYCEDDKQSSNKPHLKANITLKDEYNNLIAMAYSNNEFVATLYEIPNANPDIICILNFNAAQALGNKNASNPLYLYFTVNRTIVDPSTDGSGFVKPQVIYPDGAGTSNQFVYQPKVVSDGDAISVYVTYYLGYYNEDGSELPYSSFTDLAELGVAAFSVTIPECIRESIGSTLVQIHFGQRSE